MPVFLCAEIAGFYRVSTVFALDDCKGHRRKYRDSLHLPDMVC
jgi:hypothetical protein